MNITRLTFDWPSDFLEFFPPPPFCYLLSLPLPTPWNFVWPVVFGLSPSACILFHQLIFPHFSVHVALPSPALFQSFQKLSSTRLNPACASTAAVAELRSPHVFAPPFLGERSRHTRSSTFPQRWFKLDSSLRLRRPIFPFPSCSAVLLSRIS